MKMLEDRIRKDGIVREGNVLKVDSFINHQMDIRCSPSRPAASALRLWWPAS